MAYTSGPAVRAGAGEEVRAITEVAMRGEIDFSESFKKRVSLLKGLDESVLQEIAENLPIMDGADRLMHILKKCGYKIAILSGGFTFFGKYLKKRFGVDYLYANELEIKDGKLTGKHLGYRDWETDRKSTRLNSSHITRSRMPSSA